MMSAVAQMIQLIKGLGPDLITKKYEGKYEGFFLNTPLYLV